MSDGLFWRTKKLEGEGRDQAQQLLVARRMLTEVLQLLGGPVEVKADERLTPEWVQEMMKPKAKKEAPPPVVGYMQCESCGKNRRCFVVGGKKICITCRRAK